MRVEPGPDERGEPRALPEGHDPAVIRRRFMAGALLLVPSVPLALIVFQSDPPPGVFLNPALWLALGGIWFGTISVGYLTEVDALMAEARSRPGLRLRTIAIAWAPMPLSARASEARADFDCEADDYPRSITLHLNMSITWSFFVVGVACAWQAREDGVLLIGPSGTRFMSGATVEGLSLPTLQTSALRAVLEPGSRPERLPDWGHAPGPHAAAALEEIRPAQWLLGPEQPYVAFEATGAAIEKWWPSPLDSLYGIDPATGLDLARIVRGFDLDEQAARNAGAPRPTSSPAP